MTLKNFMKLYKGNACVSIKGYCEEKSYDYYTLAKEPWWNEVKNQRVTGFSIIGGGMYKMELCVCLEGDTTG